MFLDEEVVTPDAPANCAFGGPGNKTLLVTARPSVYKVKLRVWGVKITGR